MAARVQRLRARGAGPGAEIAPADERAPVRFVLGSAECELLFAFAGAGSLDALAQQVGREVSVVSRQIKRLAETAPVLEKRHGRWVLTSLGQQMARWTEAATESQRRILMQQTRLLMRPAKLPTLDRAALVLIGCQRGFDDPAWGERNHPDAEREQRRLLEGFRRAERPVAHVQHLSREPGSPLKPGTRGVTWKPGLEPRAGELVIKKSGNSAFINTGLEVSLRAAGVETVVAAGFSLNHCVDASVRSASDLGFSVFLISDATVAFDRAGPDGTLLRADEIERAVLATLNQEFAVVITTDDVLASD